MVHLWIDNLHGQEQRQLGQGGGLVTVDLRADAVSRTFNPHRYPPGCGIDLSEDHESFRAMPNEMLQAPSAERAATAQGIDGFEQTGLTGRIGSADQREMRVGVQFRRLQAAEIRYLQSARAHGLQP